MRFITLFHTPVSDYFRERRTVARHRRRIYQKFFLMVYQAVLYHTGQVRPIAAAGTVSASALFAITCQEPPGVEKSTIRLGVRVWFESFCEGATGRDAFRRFSPGLKFLFSKSFRGFSFRAQISCSKSFRRFSPRPQEGFTMKIWFSEVFPEGEENSEKVFLLVRFCKFEGAGCCKFDGAEKALLSWVELVSL